MTEEASSAQPAPEPQREHVARNVQALAEIHVQSERKVSPHQRAVETGTALLGRPASIYVIVLLVVGWVALNTLGLAAGQRVPDPPPFVWLQGLVGIAALLTATMVLTTQNRQAKLMEKRMHLDLQVNLLTEQKTAKLIELIEELRRDLPNVRNRRDSEAEVMKHATEPLKVIEAMEEHAVDNQLDDVDRSIEASADAAEAS